MQYKLKVLQFIPNTPSTFLCAMSDVHLQMIHSFELILFIGLVKAVDNSVNWFANQFEWFVQFPAARAESSEVDQDVRVLSLRSSVIHGFCDRALTLPSCPVFMWVWVRVWVRVRVRVRVRHSLACMPCLMLERGVRIPALMSFVSGFGHSRSAFCLVMWVCGLEFARSRALLSMCVLWCCTQFVLLSAACIHVITCAVWHAACVFHWLRAFMMSCLVWKRGLWIFSLSRSTLSSTA